MVTWVSYLIVCPLVFLGALVDAIAGGGGLITLPAYLLAGIPTHFALGSNKFSSAAGTAISTARYVRSRCIDFSLAVPTVIASLIGSFIGTNLTLVTDEKILQYVMIAVLPLMAYFVLKEKDFGSDPAAGGIPRKKQLLIAAIAAFFIGGYDGFYGPGAGTLMLFALCKLAKMDVRTASGNMKAINLASNVAALFTFILHGKVIYPLACAAAVFSIGGHYIGSGLVLKNGAKVVRPIILLVLALLMAKLIMGW